jgi:hypothetical protein
MQHAEKSCKPKKAPSFARIAPSIGNPVRQLRDMSKIYKT